MSEVHGATPGPIPGAPGAGVRASATPGPAAEGRAEATPPARPDPDGSETDAPETGDLVIDAALRDLAAVSRDDLDAQIERGEQVQRTLQGRLGDLGG